MDAARLFDISSTFAERGEYAEAAKRLEKAVDELQADRTTFAHEDTRKLLRSAAFNLAQALNRIGQFTRALSAVEVGMRCDPTAVGRAIALSAKAKPLLDIADVVLSTDDPMLQGLHDDVASTALAGQITYGNKTDKWDESIKLRDASLTIAIGRAVRERIERNLEIVRQNHELGRCHFCGNRASVEKATYQVAMHGDVQATQYGRSIHRTWNHTTVKVPRCQQCKVKMRIFRAISYPLAVGLIAAIVSLLCLEVPSAIEVFQIVGGCLALLVFANGIGIFIVIALGFYSAQFVEAALHRVFAVLLNGKWRPAKLYPAIKKLKGENWNFGKEPGSLFPRC